MSTSHFKNETPSLYSQLVWYFEGDYEITKKLMENAKESGLWYAFNGIYLELLGKNKKLETELVACREARDFWESHANLLEAQLAAITHAYKSFLESRSDAIV